MNIEYCSVEYWILNASFPPTPVPPIQQPLSSRHAFVNIIYCNNYVKSLPCPHFDLPFALIFAYPVTQKSQPLCGARLLRMSGSRAPPVRHPANVTLTYSTLGTVKSTMKTIIAFFSFALFTLYSYGVTYTDPGTYTPFEGQTITIQQTNVTNIVYSIEFSTTASSITIGPITKNMPSSNWQFYCESKYRVWVFNGVNELTLLQNYYRKSGIYTLDFSTKTSMDMPSWVLDQIPHEVADALPASIQSQLRNTKTRPYSPIESIHH